MAVKEGLKARASKVKRELLSTGRVVVKAPALVYGAEVVIRFLLAAVLAGAEIFGGYAPFGVAMVGASGSGAGGFAALLGAAFGYIGFRGLVEGLRYLAAAVLVFAVSFAFFDIKLYKKSWFMPLVTAAMTGCTGFVYLSQAGWRTSDVIFFGTELLLAGGSAYFYKIVLGGFRKEQTERDLKRTVSALILGFTALVSLAQLHLFGDVSLGRVLAALAVMLCAYEGGIGAGAAVGVAAGVAMDMAVGAGAFYAMVYGFSGLLAGVFSGRGKLPAAVTYVLADALAVLWTWDGGLRSSVLYEVFFASVLFMLLPQKLLRRAGVLFREEDENDAYVRGCIMRYVRSHLTATAEAFRDLYENMRAAFRSVPPNDNDTAVIFDRAASKVCRDCPLSSTCWEREYVSTFNALNDAIPAMVDRGRGEGGDFPGWFTSRCLHFPAFLAAANEELSALLYRRQYHGRLQENRSAVVGQYARLASVLRTAAAEVGEEPLPDPVKEKRLRQKIEELDLDGAAAVYYDRAGRLRVEIAGRHCERLARPEELDKLSAVLETPMTVEGDISADRLVLRQAEPYKAVIGAAVRQKDGETVSGDAGVCFRGAEGRLYVLLCDGMGSGSAAGQESGFTTRLLERFLKAGVEPETALRTLNGALALRGEQNGGFSTIDLLELDLYTGGGSLYKYGAAPTFLKQKEGVIRCGGASLPSGLAGEEEPPAVSRVQLQPGDCLVMVSDGVISTAGDEDALREQLRIFNGENPNALARQIIGSEAAEDDKTALVLCFRTRA